MKKILILLMLLIVSFVWSGTSFYSDHLSGNLDNIQEDDLLQANSDGIFVNVPVSAVADSSFVSAEIDSLYSNEIYFPYGNIQGDANNDLLIYATSDDLALSAYGQIQFLLKNDLAIGSVITMQGGSKEITDTDGVQAWLSMTPSINQTGTATALGLWIKALETSLGSGGYYPILVEHPDGTDEFYVDSDGNGYFAGDLTIDGSIIGTLDIYGEMGNVFGSSATEAIPSADEWAAMYHTNITGSAPHLNNGFSFVAGIAGSGNVTTAQGGSSINVADAAHGLATGDYVTVQSANHVGVGTVLYVDAGNFEVDIAYVGDEAATWQMGSYLLVANAGTYSGVWHASFSQSLANAQTSAVTPYVNTTQSTKAYSSHKLSNATDIAVIGGAGLMTFSVDDRIWFAAQTTSAQTLTFTIRNVAIK